MSTQSGRIEVETEDEAAVEPGARRRRRVGAPAGAHGIGRFAAVLGIAWSIVFVAVALAFDLELYGDGAFFSYAVAVQDSWVFHWRNIAVRSFVHVYSHLPAEFYVAATGDVQAGVTLYSLLFFAAPTLGLALTFVVDRSHGRLLFVGACVSTALLCPLVFGFPTETWLTHATFWPALACCHYAPRTPGGGSAVFAMLTALVFTHEGGLIFGAAILATMALRSDDGYLLKRAAIALAVAVALWTAVKISVPPDDYIAPVLARAGLRIIELTNFNRRICRVIVAALAFHAAAFLTLRRLGNKNAATLAGFLAAATLLVYWLFFDASLHADERYLVRTVLLALTPTAGGIAALMACSVDEDFRGWRAPLGCLARRLTAVPAGCLLGAMAIVTLIHAVETVKFVGAWTRYVSSIRELATGASADPALGDARFVSSKRVDGAHERLAWNSTTPFLAVMVAPGLSPTRLVIDPSANYMWLSCETATANERAPRSIPAESRGLVRAHACLRPRRW